MRLIDADGFLEYIGLYDTKETRECNAGEIVTLEDFDAQPTIDATPVVHGHWEEDEKEADPQKTFQCFYNMNMGMVLECFDNAVKDWRRTFCDVVGCNRK